MESGGRSDRFLKVCSVGSCLLDVPDSMLGDSGSQTVDLTNGGPQPMAPNNGKNKSRQS